MFGALRRILEDNVLIDAFNPNTRADQQRRLNQGQSSFYVKGQPAQLPNVNQRANIAASTSERENIARRLQREAQGLAQGSPERNRLSAHVKAVLSGGDAATLRQYQNEVFNPSTRRTGIGQFTQPAVGAFANLAAKGLANVSSLAGGAVEALTPFNSAGQAMQRFGAQQSKGIDEFIQAGSANPHREGENRLVTGLGQAAGTIAGSALAGRTGGVTRGGIGVTRGGATLGKTLISTRLAPSVAFGVSAGSESFRDAKQAGSSTGRALTTGLVRGVTEGALERVFPEGMRSGARGVKSLAYGASREGLEEFSQSLAGNIIEDLGFKDVDYSQAIAQALQEGGLGAIAGGGFQVAVDVAGGASDITQRLISKGVPQARAKQIANKITDYTDPKKLQQSVKKAETTYQEAKNKRIELINYGGTPQEIAEAKRNETKAENNLRRQKRLLRINTTGMGASTIKVDDSADPLDSLRQEAKKYKSAEEFADSYGKVYHGTDADLADIGQLASGRQRGDYTPGSRSIFATENPEISKKFGKNVLEGRNTGKTLDTTKLGDPHDPNKMVVPKEFSDYKTNNLLTTKDRRVLEESYFKGGTPSNITIDHLPNIHKYFKSKGYSAIQIPRASDVTGSASEMVIIDPTKIKTRDQLTSLYNEATQTTSDNTPQRNRVSSPESGQSREQVSLQPTYDPQTKLPAGLSQSVDPKTFQPPITQGQLLQTSTPATRPRTGRIATGEQTTGGTDSSNRIQRGFTQSVKGSKEVSTETKREVGSTYEQITDKATLDKSAELVGNGLDVARESVSRRLQESQPSAVDVIKKKQIDKQLVSDTIAVAKTLDASGDYASAGDLYDTIAERLTVAGQAIQAASLLSTRTPEGMIYHARKTLKSAGVEITPDIEAEINSIVNNMKAAESGEAKNYEQARLAKFVANQIPSNFGDKLTSFWKAGLLTGIKTQTGNITSNTALLAVKKASDVVSAGLDAAISLKTGSRSKSLTFRGIRSGGLEGFKKAWQVLKTGIDERKIADKYDYRQVNYKNKYIDFYVKGVFNLMGAADRPAYYASLRNNLYDIGLTEAKNQGLGGREAVAFAEKFVREPNVDAFQMATDAAERSVFANDTTLSRIAAGIKKAAEGSKATSAVVNFLMPFTRVPSAVISRLFDYSPAGAIKTLVQNVGKDGIKDQRALVEGLGEATTGSALLWLGAQLVQAGVLTLGYPDDEKERELWELEGKQENSILVNGQWLSLNYTSPVGQVIGVGGMIGNSLKDGDGITGAVSTAVAGSGKVVLDQSFLQGIQGALDAVNDPERSAGKYVNQQVSSFIPTIVKDVAEAKDPQQRKTDSLMDKLKSRVPGVRESLLPKRDTFGQPLDRKNSSGDTLVNPFRPSNVKESTPLTAEMRRLQDAGHGVVPTAIKKKESFDGQTVELSSKQIDNLEQLLGPAIETSWQATIRSPEYQQMNDEERQKELRDVAEDVRAAMKVRFMEDNSIGDVKAATDKLSRHQFSLYKNGVKASKNLDDNFQVGQPVSEVQDNDSYAQYIDKYNLDTSDQQKGTGKYSTLIESNTVNEKIGKARQLYKGAEQYKDVPQWVKDRYYKEAGVTPNDLELDIAAGFKVADKTDFIRSQIGKKPYNERLDAIANWMKPTVSGEYFASYGVIDELADAGVITKDDAKALKRLKYDEKSKKFVDRYSSSGKAKKGRYDFKIYGGQFSASPSSMNKSLRAILESAQL